jgi:hypothetical protein
MTQFPQFVPDQRFRDFFRRCRYDFTFRRLPQVAILHQRLRPGRVVSKNQWTQVRSPQRRTRRKSAVENNSAAIKATGASTSSAVSAARTVFNATDLDLVQTSWGWLWAATRNAFRSEKSGALPAFRDSTRLLNTARSARAALSRAPVGRTSSTPSEASPAWRNQLKTSSSVSKKSSLPPEAVGHSVFKKSRAGLLARNTPLFSTDLEFLDINSSIAFLDRVSTMSGEASVGHNSNTRKDDN